MKKGKQNHSNIIAVTALSLLCVGILGGAFLLNRSPEPVFEPAASEPAAETVTWSEPETKAARINQRRLQQKRLRIRKDRKLQLLQPIQTSMKVRFMTLSSAGRPQVLPRQISWITMGM